MPMGKGKEECIPHSSLGHAVSIFQLIWGASSIWHSVTHSSVSQAISNPISLPYRGSRWQLCRIVSMAKGLHCWNAWSAHTRLVHIRSVHTQSVHTQSVHMQSVSI